MNEDMRVAWLEITQMLGEPTKEELDVFLRTWQRASQATREALAEQPAQQEPVFTYDQVKAHIQAAMMSAAQRTWVGLNDDELADFWFKQSLDWMEFARVIEDALRSKNT